MTASAMSVWLRCGVGLSLCRLLQPHVERDSDAWAELHVIGVDPTYQRRGIGKMLLQYGIDGARADGKDAYLIAAPAGMALYRGNGFQSLGSLDLGMPHNLMYLKTVLDI